MASRPRPLIPILLAAAASIWAAMLVLGGGDADKASLLFLYAGNHPELADAARIVTGLGGIEALIAATFLALIPLALRRDWRTALLLLAIPLSGRLLVELHKTWAGRLRPEDQEHLVATQSYAFPSGHTANATITFLTIALLLAETSRGRKWGILAAAIVAFAVGISRPMLGVHWPSDVVGGWAFGLFWTLLLLRLFARPPTDCSPASRSRSRG